MKRISRCLLMGVITSALLFEWLFGIWLFESPLSVVLPTSTIVLSLGALLLAGSGLKLVRSGFSILFFLLLVCSLVPAIAVVIQDYWRIRYVDVRTISEGVELAGTICLPRHGTELPAAVMVHGSGQATRKEGLFYARYLARRGIAALAYDKRGSGESGGDTYEAGYKGYAADAVAMWNQLVSRPEVAPGKTGFIGVSEGEWVVSVAASQANAGFAVIISGSGLSPAEQVRESIGIRVERAGFGQGEAREAQRIHDHLHDYLRGELSKSQFEKLFSEAKVEPWFGAATNLPRQVWPRSDYQWWTGVMDFSAAPYWTQYKGHSLFVKGLRDDRSEGDQLANRVREQFEGSEAPEPEFMIFPSADHAMLTWPLGEGIPPPNWPEGYPQGIADWITSVTRASPSAER